LPLLQQVLEQYPKEVKLVSKNYPIPTHAFSRQATTAVLAAGEQGKYWEYHEKIFANMSALSDQKLLDIAREVGLNMDSFQKSLKDPKHQNAIDKDISDANRAGVRGTPTIFINGRILTNRSLEGFKAMIDEELKKKK
jgi:protein-disulfide isomerase